MATDNSTYDPLRNPQVDYERADLSAKGILWFLIGLFIAGFFIELVLWGMFRFMAHSEVLFPQGQLNPMAAAQQAPAGATNPPSILQNTPAVNLDVFPQPRLQTNDAGEMTRYVDAEQALLNVKQPFADPSGVIHIPIALAMQLIEERGLPVRPAGPPPAINGSTDSGSMALSPAAAAPKAEGQR